MTEKGRTSAGTKNWSPGPILAAPASLSSLLRSGGQRVMYRRTARYAFGKHLGRLDAMRFQVKRDFLDFVFHFRSVSEVQALYHMDAGK